MGTTLPKDWPSPLSEGSGCADNKPRLAARHLRRSVLCQQAHDVIRSAWFSDHEEAFDEEHVTLCQVASEMWLAFDRGMLGNGWMVSAERGRGMG